LEARVFVTRLAKLIEERGLVDQVKLVVVEAIEGKEAVFAI